MIGSILRYTISGVVQRISGAFTFPLGTLAVNILGCLSIGFLSQLAETRGAFSPETRGLLIIGILGGFTTFSTFANETFNLWQDGEILLVSLNLLGHIILGMGSVWLGHTLAQILWR
jgi:CrcB protein